MLCAYLVAERRCSDKDSPRCSSSVEETVFLSSPDADEACSPEYRCPDVADAGGRLG